MRNQIFDKYEKMIAERLGIEEGVYFENFASRYVEGKSGYPDTWAVSTSIQYSKDEYSGGHYRLRTKIGHSSIATFKIAELYGCCAFLVSYHSLVYPQYRNKGIGKLLNDMRIEMAKELGYTAIICTDRINNVHQRSILSKNNWKDVLTLTNKRTSNDIALSVTML